jgi:hypothetical protein
MPMGQSKPIFFSCPNCEARYKIVMTMIFDCPCCASKYNIVMIEDAGDLQRDKIGCLNCEAQFPTGEGGVFVKYYPVNGPNRRFST